MGIIEKLSSMKTETELKEMKERERLIKEEENKKREKEEAELIAIRNRQQKILDVLNSDDPELDIPYPYMERRTRELITGREYEIVKTPCPSGPMEKIVITKQGHKTGEKTSIFIGSKVVTKREIMLRKLVKRMGVLGSKGQEILEKKEGDGKVIKDYEFKAVILEREEVEKYDDLIPESVKEEIELRRRKIDLIKSRKNVEMLKKGFLVPGFREYETAVRTTLKKILVALGEEDIETYFLSDMQFRKEISQLRESEKERVLKCQGRISFQSIKKAIKKHIEDIRGER